jgi:hypothetical protein
VQKSPNSLAAVSLFGTLACRWPASAAGFFPSPETRGPKCRRRAGLPLRKPR